MECNRDEAVRAKEIAEKKFLANDLDGAKKFALKAQNLFPPLDGICQMIATLDVHYSAVARFDGEKDWYAILCVDPLADEETVKKQYRKLALQFHPDKNKSVGAEGAFQLISEAWSVLSDKSKRMLYDHKRFGRAFQPKTTTVKKDHSVPNNYNGIPSSMNNAAPKVRAQKRKGNTQTVPISCDTKAPSSQPPKPVTFWTLCNHCKTQYEYLRAYINQTLLCPNCHKSFVASETIIPSTVPDSSAQTSSWPLRHNSNLNSSTKNGHSASTFVGAGSSGFQHGVNPDFNSSSKFQWGPFSRSTGAASASASTTAAAQAANVVHNTCEKLRREHEQAQAAARREEAIRGVASASASTTAAAQAANVIHNTCEKLRREREQAQAAARREEAIRRRSELKRNSSGFGNLNAGLDGNEHTSTKADKPAKRRRGIIDDSRMNYGVTGNGGMCPANPSESVLKSSQFKIRTGFPQGHVMTSLMRKSKDEIHKIVEAWSSEKAAKSAEKENAKKKQKFKESVNEKVKEANHENVTKKDRVDEPSNNSKQAPPMSNSANTQDMDSDNKVMEPVNIDVPDPDFHDFDNDRTERSFKGDEIWATYDNEDGMPRYYALVQKVISYKPFRLRMSFLNSKSNTEFGPLDWVASGFAKTSGEFRIGRYEVNDTLNVFSHRVKWEKGLRGVIKILPRQGDIWALYRNWSPDWDEHTPDEVMYKYDMVEVLEDYNEEQGVSVAPLVKVAGFKTVFNRHPDLKKVKRIPREEIFRLSHQVPSYVLTGEEGHNAPKGCFELDPAATPLELLQVVTETKDDKVMQVSELQQQQQTVS